MLPWQVVGSFEDQRGGEGGSLGHMSVMGLPLSRGALRLSPPHLSPDVPGLRTGRRLLFSRGLEPERSSAEKASVPWG